MISIYVCVYIYTHDICIDVCLYKRRLQLLYIYTLNQIETHKTFYFMILHLYVKNICLLFIKGRLARCSVGVMDVVTEMIKVDIICGRRCSFF